MNGLCEWVCVWTKWVTIHCYRQLVISWQRWHLRNTPDLLWQLMCSHFLSLKRIVMSLKSQVIWYITASYVWTLSTVTEKETQVKMICSSLLSLYGMFLGDKIISTSFSNKHIDSKFDRMFSIRFKNG